MALDQKIYELRKEKLKQIEALGQQAYPYRYETTHTVPQILEGYSAKTGPELESPRVNVSVAGRLMSIRVQGKAGFAHLQQGGQRLQIYVRLDNVGEKAFQLYKLLDLGDYIGVKGYLFRTRTNELTVHVEEITFLVKDLLPLPEKWHGLQDVETRYRRRYVDLTMNPDVREVFLKRAKVVQSMRRFLDTNGFIEVETPMMHPIAGGAVAKPFITHHNALDVDLYLRIAPELFLKRAVVGGIEKVFEINRNFRNEGADSSHSPEFSMLEAYEAYGDYMTMATLTREIVQGAAVDLFGSTEVTHADGTPYDLGGDWASLTLYGSLSEALGTDITPATSVAELGRLCEAAGISVDPKRVNHGKLVEVLWEHHVGDHLSAPTFVMDFPVETSPLTRDHRTQAGIVEKWDLYVKGFELGTAYSELVDPVIQRERFEQQARMAAQGDDESMRLDEDFLTAMEHGMPPAGGMGMGIDRLLMALTGLGIRETILFPLVKPEEGR